MKKFLLNCITFGTIGITIPLCCLLFLPATPRSQSSLLFAELDKNILLKTINAPRIIFIGGSNLSFGINSQTIKDSLSLNPINASIHAGIGLIYMLDNTLEYIRAGDIVIVVPEYAQFFDNYAYGDQELLRTIFEVPNDGNFKNIGIKQLINVSPYFLHYIFSKVKTTEYEQIKEHPLYSRSSFNKFGDVDTHWNLPNQEFAAQTTLEGELNTGVLEVLESYQNSISNKGAQMFISFPGYQSASFNNSRKQIFAIERQLKIRGFRLLGNPSRYKIPDSLMFNTPYHLSKQGVDYRTRLLIEDLKSSMSEVPFKEFSFSNKNF